MGWKRDMLAVENAHEPLIRRELWDAVQATLRPRPAKGERAPFHALQLVLPAIRLGHLRGLRRSYGNLSSLTKSY